MLQLIKDNPHLTIMWVLYGVGVLVGFNAVMREQDGSYIIKLLLVWIVYPILAVITPILSIFCIKTVIDSVSQKKERHKKWKLSLVK